MGGRVWTQQEDDLLDKMYNNKDIKYISGKLKRTKRAIEHRSQYLGLSYAKEYYTCADVSKLFGVTKSQVSESWNKKYGLKVKRINKCMGTKKFSTCITQEDLLEWLENNQERYNTINLEHMALGVEPCWLKEKRRHDLMNRNFMRRIAWTKYEEDRVMKYYRDGLKHKEIAKKMNRSECSVYARIHKILDKK